MFADGGHLGWRSGSQDIILKVDHLRTIHAMFALNWLTDFRGNFTRLRHQCSSLGADLFRANIVSDPSCACGCPLEDAIHYLLECPLYTNARMQLIMSITPYTVISIENLLFGSDNLTDENNLIVFRNVHKYIHHSNRFE